MLPTFLIIGSQKAGTTSMYHVFRRHPEIYMPEEKEIGFFSHDDLYRRGVSFYEDFFMGAGDARAIGEANHLPQERYRSYLCTTRADGPLRADLSPHVGHICLRRKQRFDTSGLKRFVSFVRDHHISIIHAHNSALFVATLVSLLPPFPKIVWHCHSGWSGENLPMLPYFGMIRRVQTTIVVNDLIHQWIVKHLRYPTERIWYIPNFSTLLEHQFTKERSPVALPGAPGRRIVCVANLLPRKDQLTLMRIMPTVLDQVPDAHLILVGGEPDKSYADVLRQESKRLGLEDSVTLLGARRDITAILTACDVGVLSSVSEGLPVALLEYGLAGLGVVCTRVGQCAEVLDEGKAGFLVPPRDPMAMASALISMLLGTSLQRMLAKRFQERVRSCYSLEQAIAKIDSIYKAIGGQN